MGDRGITLVKAGADIAPCAAYVHWTGEESVEHLKGAIPGMRKGDAAYSVARLIGYLHTQIPGNSSLGVIEPPENLTPETLKEYSHGDAGVLVYDCEDGTLTAYGGYIARRIESGDMTWTPAIPPR